MQHSNLDRAVLKPCDKLCTMLAQMDSQKPIAVNCGSGFRSCDCATSLLHAEGLKSVTDAVGVEVWQVRRHPHMSKSSSASTCTG